VQPVSAAAGFCTKHGGLQLRGKKCD